MERFTRIYMPMAVLCVATAQESGVLGAKNRVHTQRSKGKRQPQQQGIPAERSRQVSAALFLIVFLTRQELALIPELRI